MTMLVFTLALLSCSQVPEKPTDTSGDDTDVGDTGSATDTDTDTSSWGCFDAEPTSPIVLDGTTMGIGPLVSGPILQTGDVDGDGCTDLLVQTEDIERLTAARLLVTDLPSASTNIASVARANWSVGLTPFETDPGMLISEAEATILVSAPPSREDYDDEYVQILAYPFDTVVGTIDVSDGTVMSTARQPEGLGWAFGRNMALADVTGDGVAEFLVGDNRIGTWDDYGGFYERQRFWIASGTPGGEVTSADRLWEIPTSCWEDCGVSDLLVHDVDGDGLNDVLLGYEPNTPFITQWAGPLAGWPYDAPDREIAARSGRDVTLTAGDMNGDGYDDVFVGMPSVGNAGHLLPGPLAATSLEDATSRIEGDPSEAGYRRPSDPGRAVTLDCDMDGDGRRDLVITQSLGTDGTGAVYVVPSPLPASVVLADEYTLGRGYRNAQIGWDVACMGDLDQDGRDDVATTASGTDATGEQASGIGEVWILLSDL